MRYEPVFFDIETTGLNPMAKSGWNGADYDAHVTAVGVGRLKNWRSDRYGCEKVIEVFCETNEYYLLKTVREHMAKLETSIEGDVTGPDNHPSTPTEMFLVGYNSRSFDHPYICARFSRFRQNPFPFGYRKKRLDMSRLFGGYISQDDAAAKCGVEVVDDSDGSDMPQLFEEGDLEAIEYHCKEDIRVMMEMFMEKREEAMDHLFGHYDGISGEPPRFNESVDL